MTASEIHLLASAFFGTPNLARRGLEGLWSSGSNRFSERVAAPESREAFAGAVIGFISLELLTAQ
jgi:hypothetical protein